MNCDDSAKFSMDTARSLHTSADYTRTTVVFKIKNIINSGQGFQSFRLINEQSSFHFLLSNLINGVITIGNIGLP